MAALTGCIQLVQQSVRPSARWPEPVLGGISVGGQKHGFFVGGATLTGVVVPGLWPH